MRSTRVSSRERQQRELTAEATQILRAANRRERVVAERAPCPKARSLPPAWPNHLRLAPRLNPHRRAKAGHQFLRCREKVGARCKIGCLFRRSERHLPRQYVRQAWHLRAG
jgi:hypothetical protein